MIYLSKDIGFLSPPLDGRTVCVVHKAYPAPNIPDARVVAWEGFEEDPQGCIKGFDNLVMVGLNKLITPSTRTKHVWEIVYNRMRDIRKVSIDRMLFVSEPWRAWFHFGFVGAKYLDYGYSYIAETRWKQWRDGVEEFNPFSAEEILTWAKGIVVCDYVEYFGRPTITVMPTTAAQKVEYEDLKAHLFETETTIKGVITKLARYAREVCPERRVPTLARVFDREQHEIVRTDLKVDEHLVSELVGLMELTNAIAEGLRYG